MLFKSDLRILLLNSGDPQSSLARFLNSDLQRSPKFTRVLKSTRAGKNATDSFLIIDAMDLLHSGSVGGFCIVSSDSDFTGLAKRNGSRSCS